MTLIILYLNSFVNSWTLYKLQATSILFGTCTYRNIDSLSALRAIGPTRNLNIVPINPCSRSGHISGLLFRHSSLYFDAALLTRLTLPGLFGFSTRCSCKYRSFSNVSCTSESPKNYSSLFLHM